MYLADKGGDVAVLEILGEDVLLELVDSFNYEGFALVIPTDYIVKLLILVNLGLTSSISKVLLRKAGIWLLMGGYVGSFAFLSFLQKLDIINLNMKIAN